MTIGTPGVLPDSEILRFVDGPVIESCNPVEPAQIQPASLDLRLGSVAYRVRVSFLPGKDRTVRERLEEFRMHRLDIDDGVVLEKGCVYVVQLQERVSLPQDVHAAANAKSSTGRLDLLTRLVADGGTEFDRVDDGYRGPLYAEICPRSFSVLVRTGSRLNQIRFRRGVTSLSDEELGNLQRDAGLVSGDASIDGGLGFSVGIQKDNSETGFKAKPHAGIIDVDRAGLYDPSEFWDPVYASNGSIILDPGSFYILASRNAVSVPPEYAAEMVPYIAMVGEFRVHYAGFFDPGFGHGSSGGAGSKAVLEVRCHEAPFLLEDGQLVGRLVFERMAAKPHAPYGVIGGSNYQGQGLKLSKHFKRYQLPSAGRG